jgi:nitroreductase/N-acetylglutamate synthase-like GNAT family acetyltransferase
VERQDNGEEAVMRIESAEGRDLAGIAALLEQVGLPPLHLEEHLGQFLVARSGGRICGCVGMEIYGDSCLLRSLAVLPDCQGKGIGRRLVEGIVVRGREIGMRRAVILTNSAAEFAARFGFVEVSRCSVDGLIGDSWEFRAHACDSAVCMKLELIPPREEIRTVELLGVNEGSKGGVEMDFYQLIEGRESIRNYDPERPVDSAVLKRILNAGRMAPSAVNRQPWRFLLISSPEMLAKVRKCYTREWFREAPHLLVVVGNRDGAWTRDCDGYNSIETDLTIAMDHMVLAAEYEEVGTCWIEAYDPEILREVLELKGNEVVFSITPLGYPKEGFEKGGRKERKRFEEVVEFL